MARDVGNVDQSSLCFHTNAARNAGLCERVASGKRTRPLPSQLEGRAEAGLLTRVLHLRGQSGTPQSSFYCRFMADVLLHLTAFESCEARTGTCAHVICACVTILKVGGGWRRGGGDCY